MPRFFSKPSNFWTDPGIQPKRPYRFIVPIPIIMPDENTRAHKDWFSNHFVSDGAISLLNRWEGVENIVEFPVLSCTKPGFKTEAYRTTNGAGGYAKIRQNQPSVYNFSPIILEIVDTISHDLESTITALLYARGQLKNAHELINNPDAGRLISFGNEVEVIEGGGCGKLVQTNLMIYEVDAETTYRSGGGLGMTPWPKARVLKLNNSCIVGAEFGMLDHRGEQLSSVRLTIDYDSFDYKTSMLPYPGPSQTPGDIREERQARRENRQQERRITRALRQAGMSRKDIQEQRGIIRAQQNE